jgi:RND family efflux transporter MFP subunit
MLQKPSFGRLLIIAGVPVAMIIVGRGKLSSAAAPDPAPLVSVVTATPQQLPTKLVIVGTIEPVVKIDLGAREAGTLAAVAVNIGDHVTKGEVLASLDTGQLAPDLAAAEARLRMAEANGAATASAYERVADIRATGAIAPEQIDDRAADAAAQEAQIGIAKADLAAAQARLADAAIVAPTDGVIAGRDAEAGQYAAPGGPPLFTLLGNQGLIFRATIPQDQLALIAPGMAVTLDLPGGTVTGKMIGADPAVDASTHLGTVRVALPRNPALRVGAFIEASVDLGRHTQIAVPQTALVADASGFHVVVVEHGVTVFQPVTLASLPGNASSLVPIASGIAPGDVIVADAGASLFDDQRVRPVD